MEPKSGVSVGCHRVRCRFRKCLEISIHLLPKWGWWVIISINITAFLCYFVPLFLKFRCFSNTIWHHVGSWGFTFILHGTSIRTIPPLRMFNNLEKNLSGIERLLYKKSCLNYKKNINIARYTYFFKYYLIELNFSVSLIRISCEIHTYIFILFNEMSHMYTYFYFL